MAFNPAILRELEEAGLSNLALEQVVMLLRSHQGCNVTWHIDNGQFLKVQCGFTANLRHPRAVQCVTMALETMAQEPGALPS